MLNGSIKVLAAATVTGSLLLAGATHADMQEDEHKSSGQDKQKQLDPEAKKIMMEAIEDWPEGPRKEVELMVQKFGPPTGLTETRVIWNELDGEPWHEVVVSKETTDHNFPKPHQDYLETTVFYAVPADKYDDLAEFDGSVYAERTRGTLSARCHKLGPNILALNLAHDIIEGTKSVSEARQAYADAIKQNMQGETPDIMKKLMFKPMSEDEARDPGEAIIDQ